jgi:uncharacterized 2Fe-2S/4Fe-4S cluster protein (DUF4445 family)
MIEIYDISFNPLNIKGKSQKGLTIFEAAENLNIFLRSDCGKKGTCGKCRVLVRFHFHAFQDFSLYAIPNFSFECHIIV